MARAEQGSRGGEQGRGRERTTRGGHPSRRWSGGSGKAAAKGKALRRRQEEQSRAARARGRRTEGGGPRGLFENFRNLRDLLVN
jgi:hypothetical protein